jgi:glycosyltransferase involved in cell wall biosynthesis
MRLGAIGKGTFKTAELREDDLNGKTWLAMARHFDELFLIALSQDGKFRKGRSERTHVYLMPRVPGLVGIVLFLLCGSALSVWLTFRHRIAIWTFSEPVSALCSIPLRLLTRARLMFQLQGELFDMPPEYSGLRRQAVTRITRFACHVSDGVRAVSQRVANQAIRAGISPAKVQVFPSRCDTHMFNPELYHEQRRKIRTELGAADDEVLIIFVGRLVTAKGLTYALDAVAQLRERRSGFRYVIVGDGELRHDLEAQAVRLRLDDVVRFVGAVAYSRVPAMLSAGDIFLSPSVDEGMPRAVLEALSMGLPVVVTDVGGNGEILQSADCGYLVPSRDVDAIAAALEKLLADPVKAHRMGAAGRRLVLERYDFDTQILALAEAHRALVCHAR